MSTALAVGALRSMGRRPPWVAVLIVGAALLAGLAAGDPSPTWWIPLGVCIGLAVLCTSLRWPYESLLVMLGSTILLVVVRLVGLRAINLIDILMPSVVFASLLSGVHRSTALAGEVGPTHERLVRAERRLVAWVVAFYALAVLSLFRLATIAGVGAALDSGLIMIRAIQGLLIYPLCMWWLRTSSQIHRAWGAIVVAGVALVIVNLVGIALWDVKRAGMTFYLNNWDAPLSTPNEAGTASLIVAAVLLVRHAMRPDWRNLALGALMLVLLGLTQSRSGILAWGTFALFTLRWVRPARLISGAFTIAALLPLMPQAFWIRMARSVVVERDTFEAYSLFVRLYGWRAAWNVVLDHPWMGVGYLGFRFVSHAYNDYRLVIGTVENYYYEVLVSMGIVGLAVLAVVIVMLFQIGREVGRVSRPGSLAYHMSRFHTPLVAGLLVANMTGDNFMGMVSLAQLAMWTAVLVRSGHTDATDSARA